MARAEGVDVVSGETTRIPLARASGFQAKPRASREDGHVANCRFLLHPGKQSILYVRIHTRLEVLMRNINSIPHSDPLAFFLRGRPMGRGCRATAAAGPMDEAGFTAQNRCGLP